MKSGIKVIIVGLLTFLLIIPLWVATAAALPHAEVVKLKASSPEFKAAEEEILVVWKQLMKTVGPSEKESLKQSQLLWIKQQRDKDAQALMSQGHSMGSAYAMVTRKKTAELKSILEKHKKPSKPAVFELVEETETEPEAVLPPPQVANGGDIQVSCEPGIQIWLNGTYRGLTTNDAFGMYFENLPPGRHGIKALKKGFKPIVKNVNVKKDRTVEVTFEFKTPEYKVESLDAEEGATLVKEVGTLKLRSVPLHAKVSINNQEVGETDIMVRDYPAGELNIRFKLKDKILGGVFYLQPGRTISLKAHFIKGVIIEQSVAEGSNQ